MAGKEALETQAAAAAFAVARAPMKTNSRTLHAPRAPLSQAPPIPTKKLLTPQSTKIYSICIPIANATNYGLGRVMCWPYAQPIARHALA